VIFLWVSLSAVSCSASFAFSQTESACQRIPVAVAVSIMQHVKRSLENSACIWAASADGCLVFLHKLIWLCRRYCP